MYELLFDPDITGDGDDHFVMSFDVMSFDPGDDALSWLYLEEMLVEKVFLADKAVILSYDFDAGTEGWQFQGSVPPYDVPLSAEGSSVLGLNPNGSANCFSYWFSPDVALIHGKTYRSWYEVGSYATDPDMTVQFRLRINQKGSWQSWDRVVNSNNGQAPAEPVTKFYPVMFSPNVTDTDDAAAVFSFDMMSFDPGDDTSSWLYLDAMILEEVVIEP